MSKETILSVDNLWIEYTSGKNLVQAVNGVSFDIRKGESLGLVGESGCGKSTIARAILRLLPDVSAKIVQGTILLDGEDIVKMPKKKLRSIRGKKESMIFQDPMTSLNPTIKIGPQIMEMIKTHNQNMSKRDIREKTLEMLEMVGIDSNRFFDYPHQLSGGMQQRVVIAIALACNPMLLLADEPTTALDVTIQAQILDLINDLKNELGTSMLLITHNLSIVSEICDYVAVLYGGEIVEYGSCRAVLESPGHPYTRGLLNALPIAKNMDERLKPIIGVMPDPSDLPKGCKFHTRCQYMTEQCKTMIPNETYIEAEHYVKCFCFQKLRGEY